MCKKMSTRCILTISVLMPLLVLCTAASAPGAWFDSAWQYRKAITIDETMVVASLTDFPLLVEITDTDLQARALSGGDDILFTAGDEITKLDHEIESYDDLTGHLVAWVRVPSLSSVAPTVIYMYYDNDAASPRRTHPGYGMPVT